jgi:O-antigen/teichoic acid export membrane protein
MSSVIERTLRGGLGLFSADVIAKATGFLFIVAASRYLGPSEFGVLALGLSIFGVARNLSAFGLPNTIQRFLSGGGEEKVGQIYAALLAVGATSTVLGAGTLYLTAPLLASKVFSNMALVSPLRAFSIGTIGAVSFIILRAVLRAQEQITGVVQVDTVRGVGKVLLLGGVISIGARSAMAAAWGVSASFIPAVALAGYRVRQIRFRPILKNLVPHLKRVLGYTAPLVVVGFSYFLAQQADRLMLGWLADTAKVGVYTTTSTLAMVMSALHGALVSIFMPIASEAHREGAKERMSDAYVFISRWMGVVNGFALLAFAGGGLWILHIFGSGYATDTTYLVLVILSILYFVGTWVGPTGALLQMSDGHRIEFTNTIIFVVANIGLNYVLIVEHGVIGAALATLGSGVLRNAIQVVEIGVWYGVTPIRGRNVVDLAVVLLSMTALFLVPQGELRALLAGIGMIILGVYAFLSASEEERQAIHGFLARSSTA